MGRTPRRRQEGRQSSKSTTAVDDYHDVGLDSEDEFQEARDRISLTAERPRRHDEDIELSDEEVLALDGTDAESDDYESDEKGTLDNETEDDDTKEEQVNYTDWGKGRKAYYGGDIAEDEEDLQLQEEELARYEEQRYANRREDDYGLEQWLHDDGLKSEYPSRGVTEKLDAKRVSDLSDEEQIKLAAIYFPELGPLQDEFTSLYGIHSSLDLLYKSHQNNPLVAAKYTALCCYLATLATYFAIRSAPENERTSLGEHPVMESLLTTRQTWESVKNVNIDVEQIDRQRAEELITDISPKPAPRNLKRKRAVVSDASLGAVPSVDHEEESDIDIDTGYRAKSKTKPVNFDRKVTADDLLDSMDAEESVAKKKTLRFYTSHIDQTSKKRDRATKMQGDIDLPYRERNKEAALRKTIEAQRRGHHGGADLDDEEYDENDMRTAEQSHADLEHYNTIASRSKQNKQEKKVAHDLSRDENKAGYLEDETGVTGKRAISRDIAKNKGLTPKRSKEQRNPRVKKRKKFEKAKKQLGSKKAMHKAETGPYRGEMSGISSKVVKSVKFK